MAEAKPGAAAANAAKATSLREKAKAEQIKKIADMHKEHYSSMLAMKKEHDGNMSAWKKEHDKSMSDRQKEHDKAHAERQKKMPMMHTMAPQSNQGNSPGLG